MRRLMRQLVVPYVVIVSMLAAGGVAMLVLAQHAPQAIPWVALIFVPTFCWLSEKIADWAFASHADLVPAAPLPVKYPSSTRHVPAGQAPPAGSPHVLFGAIQVRTGARMNDLAVHGPTLATCERVGVCSCGASGPVYSGTYDVLTVTPQPHVVAWHDQHTAHARTAVSR